LAFCACSRSAEPGGPAKPAASPAGAPSGPDDPKPRDLGLPLVEDVAALKKLQPAQPVWIDAKQKRVILLGEVCQASYNLEFFATNPGREYEAVVVVRVVPSVVHAGLLAVGAVPGRPAVLQPKFNPPSGTEIEIDVYWNDREGKRQRASAKDWIRNVKTKKSLEVNWVFGGSGFGVDAMTGKRTYLADGGELISVANVPIATLDLPLRSGSALEAREFEPFTERLPPKGTPVTLVLIPKL
jgi:hypothetical protein